MTVIITPTYKEAERIGAKHGYPDWQWFTSHAVALDWVERCWNRGVAVDPVFVISG